MVVEDSVYMQTLISSMLRIFSVGDIMACDNAKDAIDVLTITQARTKSQYITKVDIVLTDWLMPKGPGEELVRWIRAHHKDEIRFMPVVVISGYTTEVITAKARDAGANEILTKPVSAAGLAGRISLVINAPRPFIKAPHYFGP